MKVIMVGRLGADAKEKDKGFSFSLPQKNWENNEETTLWVACFQNYMSGLLQYLKKGTPVQVIGDMTIGVYNDPQKGPVPSASCRVLNIELLPSNHPELKDK